MSCKITSASISVSVVSALFCAFYEINAQNMSADINKKSFISQNTLMTMEENSIKDLSISEQKVIDMTNRFYLEISKNLLSDREYEILEKILIKKSTLNKVCEEYGICAERIRQIYTEVFFKIKSVSEIFKDIDALKNMRNQLRNECISRRKKIPQRKQKIKISLNKKLINSGFPFSKRLWNMLSVIDCHTLEDLTKVPLENYLKVRGFKGKCMKEILQFIEFENIEDEFKGFHKFKKIYNS